MRLMEIYDLAHDIVAASPLTAPKERYWELRVILDEETRKMVTLYLGVHVIVRMDDTSDTHKVRYAHMFSATRKVSLQELDATVHGSLAMRAHIEDLLEDVADRINERFPASGDSYSGR